MDLDILPEHISLENYRATLAHKVCYKNPYKMKSKNL